MPKAHQRKILEAEAKRNPRAPDKSLDYRIDVIDADAARDFIVKYEWLRNVGRPVARYAAFNSAGEIADVALFGKTGGNAARDICGPYYRDLAICLERGARAPWTHEHIGSWFTTRVLKRASADHGWKIFYAYADEEAGEIGAIYQACGWLYTGQGVGHGRTTARPREYFRHEIETGGKWITDRAMRNRGVSIKAAASLGWQRKRVPAKHKYVQFVGTKRERKELFDAMVEQWMFNFGERPGFIRGPYPKKNGPLGQIPKRAG